MNGLLGETPAPPMPGNSMPSVGVDDIQLRPLWLKEAERMALGEIPQVDYETWKRNLILQMQQQQPQQPMPQQPQQAQSLI